VVGISWLGKEKEKEKKKKKREPSYSGQARTTRISSHL